MLDFGTTRRGAVCLTDRERTRHVHVVGATGSGKSKFLEHLIRQDINARRGLCLIDPKGSLAGDIEAWCASRGLGRTRRIHVVRPGEGGWTAGFNPLRLDRGEMPNVRVDATVAACAQVWGGEDLNQTPRLKKVLRAVFFALAVRDLTLAEAPFLLRAADPDGMRRTLTAGLPDSVFQFIWDDLNALSRREFSEYAESTVSRLAQFLASPSVRLMVGQRSSAIDFRRVMDEGDIVIVDLGLRGGFSREDGRVVGALIINDLFLTALSRDEATAKRRPFALYVDEAHDFLTGDVEALLDRTRSLGLHAVLAHQRLGQLTSRGENIYSAVMGSTRTKIVFGGLSDDDAGVMARELMRDEFDLHQANPMLDRRVVVGEEPWWYGATNWSEAENESHTSTATVGASETESAGSTLSEHYDHDDEATGWNEGENSASASSTHESYSESDGFSRSRTQGGGTHEGVRHQWGVAQTPYKLDELIHFGQVMLRSLPDRMAVVKRAGRHTVRMRTREVPAPLCGAATLARFREQAHERSPYAATVAVAEAEIATRRALLDARSERGVQSFWTNED